LEMKGNRAEKVQCLVSTKNFSKELRGNRRENLRVKGGFMNGLKINS